MEDRLTPRYHGKTKHKRKPTKRHLRDKLRSLEKELEWWKGLSITYVLRELKATRIRQLERRAIELRNLING